MTRFMDVHSGFQGVTAQQLKEAHERDLDIERTRAFISSAPGSTPRAAGSSASPADRAERRSCESTSARAIPPARSTSSRSKWRDSRAHERKSITCSTRTLSSACG